MSTTVPDKGAISFKETLNLPETSFPLTPNYAIDDPVLIARWDAENLWNRSFEHNQGKEKFILHDGPPYANGPIHLGHAYNKIIKDIIGKSQRMSGKHVPITPGWDCHGLPIEQKVNQQLAPGLPAKAVRDACKTYASQWVDVQREQFKKLGILMDWAHPYLTMNAEYEADIIRAFGRFFESGYVEKKLKTVPWCPADQTVLAAAEIEYRDQKDPSVYVLFTLPVDVIKAIDHSLQDKRVHAVIWTTTPWTLPLNRAVLVNPAAAYSIVGWQDQYLLLGASLIEQFSALLEAPLSVIKTISGSVLIGHAFEHPFLSRHTPIIADPLVAIDEGTAFVHCAPGCGPHDYEIGVQHGLEIYSPVGPDGKYTYGIEPQELIGMPVSDGQFWVLRKLQECGKLLLKKNITHSYPHCWRCHTKLIFRATNQWFINLGHNNLRQKALEALTTIQFLPPNSKNYLKATIEGRLEWCISRQRVWGVPIPALICNHCQQSVTTAQLIYAVADGVGREGINYWDTISLDSIDFNNISCTRCHHQDFSKEQDILDVWFDSGISHFAVLYKNPALHFPADLYFEGLDQHRGWFQSSVLTALVLEKESPMKTIVTHGFTVDEKGHKMSKSLGNVVSPDEIVAQLGTDGLRLWTSSIDHGADAVVTKALLSNINQVYRKIRNTCRFLLANLNDFDYATHAVAADRLQPIDLYALYELAFVNTAIISAYKAYDLTSVYHQLTDYCTVSLSSLYLDVIKDRLYTAGARSRERRSAQTASFIILDTLTRLIAPIMSFTAEQISDNYQKNKTASIHLQDFNNSATILKALLDNPATTLDIPHLREEGDSAHDTRMRSTPLIIYQNLWLLLQEIRSAGLKIIEGLRQKGSIKHSLEAALTLYYMPSSETQKGSWALLQSNLKERDQSLEEFFKEFFIVSSCAFLSKANDLSTTNIPGFFISVEKASGIKCPRCWQWNITEQKDGLCSRCEIIVDDYTKNKNS